MVMRYVYFIVVSVEVDKINAKIMFWDTASTQSGHDMVYFLYLHFVAIKVDAILTLMENISVVKYLKRQNRVTLTTENLDNC